jgi:hypothetical protein
MSRDCTLFVDDDGKGYFLSAANENYDLILYSLSDDYLAIKELVTKLFVGGHREAPALFKRNGVYFVLSSAATGWDPNQGQYATSRSLDSGWSGLKNVGDGTTFYSQPAFVMPVDGTEGTEFLYMGDRWAGAWGGRVNDSYYLWQPIQFTDDTSMRMSWDDVLDIDTQAGSVSGSTASFTLTNKASGLVLSVSGALDQNSSPVVVADKATAQGAAWKLDYNAAGYFKLATASGKKVVDVPNESAAAGQDLKLYDDNGGDHQAWRVIDLGQGAFRIRNEKSGHYLGAEGSTSGSTVGQESDADADAAQIWQISVAD